MSHRFNRLTGLSCCALALLGGGALAVHADAPAAAVSPADAQIQLQNALKRLDVITPSLDAQTKRNLPHIRQIITRVILHPEMATPSEIKIAGVFINHTRDIWDDAKQAATVETVQATVKSVASTAIEFVAGQGDVPGGAKKGIVYLKNPDTPAPTELVEIPAGTVTWPVEKRAQVVAKRLEAAHSSDPLWWTDLTVNRLHNQVVVMAKGAQVITADKDFAKLQGVTPEQLAANLVDKIRSTVDPSTNNTRAFASDDELTPAEKMNRANLLRQRGDDAYSQQDMGTATKLYIHATELVPNYSTAYLRLADLYIQEKQFDKAKDILQQAQGATGMDAASKAEVNQKFAEINQKF